MLLVLTKYLVGQQAASSLSYHERELEAVEFSVKSNGDCLACAVLAATIKSHIIRARVGLTARAQFRLVE
jgi:hypothetical protein